MLFSFSFLHFFYEIRFCFLWIFASLVLADVMLNDVQAKMPNDVQAKMQDEISKMPSFKAKQASWIFSGTVSNENGEYYNYYFQLQRDNDKLKAIAALIKSKDNLLVLFEEKNVLLDSSLARKNADAMGSDVNNWYVEPMFLQFNAINSSWIFGIKRKDKTGFNFKVDLLTPIKPPSTIQVLREGIDVLIEQTGQVNGHIQVEGKEEFVTGQKAWFGQLWVSNPQSAPHFLTTVFCQLANGNSFYAIKLKEKEALQGALAGWHDPLGKPLLMSQFVNIKEDKDGFWSIRIPYPKLKLAFQNLLTKQGEIHQVLAGLTVDTHPSFCTLSKTDIEQLA